MSRFLLRKVIPAVAAKPVIKGTTAAATTSVALPTHAVGDLIVLHVYRNASSTQATVPTASGTVPAWNTIATITSSTTAATRVVQFVATATNHTSGTWTSATNIIATVISGQYASPIGAFATVGGLQTGQSTAPAIGSWVNDGSSLFLHFMSTATTNPPTWSAPPTGYTQQIANGRTLFITKNDTTTDGAVTNTDNGANSVGYTGVTVEILASSQPATPTYHSVGSGGAMASATSCTFTIAVTAGDYVLVDAVHNGSTTNIVTATYDYGGANTAMTLVGSQLGNNTNGNMLRFKLDSAPATATVTIRMTIDNASYLAANAIAVSNVAYAAHVTTVFGTANASQAIQGGAGTLVVQSFGLTSGAGSPVWTSPAGGTNVYHSTPNPSGGVDLLMSYAPMGGTFTATNASGIPWAGISTVLYLTAPPAPPVQAIGCNFGSSTVTIPAHQVGDIIIISAFSNASTTPPTKPAASGTVPAWVDVDNNPGANAISMRTAYFVATATTTTSGSWSGASSMSATVCRYQNSSTPIGGHGETGGSSTAPASPAISMSDTSGKSVLLNIFHRSGGGVFNAAPAGYTDLAAASATTAVVSKSDTTSDGSCVESTTGSAPYRAAQIEIKI